IYAVHGIGGTVLTFRGVVAHLEPDQPIYCLEALGSDGSWTCLEELAALYIKDLLAFQPKGPYHLIGSSFGGMVIFEMARQLHAQGHEVGFLGMLDSGNMGRRNLWTRKERMREKLHFFRRRTLMHLKRLATRKLREWPRYSAGRVLAVGRLMQSTAWRLMYRFYRAPNKLPAPLLNMKRVYQSSGLNYVPKKYAGNITLFMARDQHNDNARVVDQLGWAGWAEQGVEVIDVPGDHNSLLQEPHVKVLTEEMTKCLARYAARNLGRSGAGL
ncbi:MAG: non-ribosomal peptide synthase, partial [Bryobacterales bacterium]|nr:non-ribosomal peptide synthase [Bryobacterales bacterium]